jgi:hypothetical protein
MLLVLCALASGAEITVRQTPAGVQALDANGEVLTARQFAEAVGDHETLAERHVLYRRMRLATGVMTWGGLGAAAVGGVGALVGMVDSDPAVALGFGALAGAGALSFGTGAALYLGGRTALNDMDRWYTYQEAQAWLDALEDLERAGTSMVIVPGLRGFEVTQRAKPMSTQGFAKQVGDLNTYRICKAARTGAMVGAIGSFVVGGYGVLIAASLEGDAVTSAVVATGAGSVVLVGAGLLFVRSALDRPSFWYSETEAQAWIDQTQTASQQSEPSLQLAVAPALIPEGDGVGVGVGLSGRW